MQREFIVYNKKELVKVFEMVARKSVDFPIDYYRPASGFLGYDAEFVDEWGNTQLYSSTGAPKALPQRGEKSDEEFFVALTNWFDNCVEPDMEDMVSPMVVTIWDNPEDTTWYRTKWDI